MKMPKCPKTVTGKHKFTDYRYSAVRENKRGVLVEYVAGDIRCEFCNIVDDRIAHDKE